MVVFGGKRMVIRVVIAMAGSGVKVEDDGGGGDEDEGIIQG